MTKTATVKLETPIKRGDSEIAELQLRKPKAGELRGLSMSEIVNADVNTIIKLVPRIALPTVTEHDMAELEADDMTEVCNAVIGFFLNKAQKVQVAELTQTPATN